MKAIKSSQEGFLPMIICLLGILVAVVVIVYVRVAKAPTG